MVNPLQIRSGGVSGVRSRVLCPGNNAISDGGPRGALTTRLGKKDENLITATTHVLQRISLSLDTLPETPDMS